MPLTAANAADGRWVLGVATGLRVTGQDDTPSFVRVPQLSDDDVQQIVETTAGRVVRLLQRRSVLEEGNVDPLWEDEPLLATITAASVQGQIATGERAGQRVRRRLLDPEVGIGLSRRRPPRLLAERRRPAHARMQCLQLRGIHADEALHLVVAHDDLPQGSDGLHDQVEDLGKLTGRLQCAPVRGGVDGAGETEIPQPFTKATRLLVPQVTQRRIAGIVGPSPCVGARRQHLSMPCDVQVQDDQLPAGNDVSLSKG